MQIVIGNFFPYELSLYGENGNIKALKYALEQKGIKVIVENIEKEDKIDFKKFDFLYIGSGRKVYLEKIKERLIPYKNDFLNYIKNNKILLVTGNAISIFDFLDFYKVEECEERKVADIKATTSLCKGIIEGFQNTQYLIDSTDSILFQLEEGYGNNNTKLEGYQEHNFYATTLIGPILARNDSLTKYFVEQLIQEKEE